ncbi:AI-2E family transporter [Leptolyngbya sp. 7M]|uniref:AI-2E family transporter n=1 Tax=Leptolyngbya sp. 7M TaxID=2812896 RepID=UPI001B8C53AF|nr:AI-2E family transporter [Leptolyngbya sp. 7M]QYO65233.1 AI-2E family transporter [Leptolyngbya sp. 7M]
MQREGLTELSFIQKTFLAVGIVVFALLLIALVYYTFDIFLLIFSAVLISIFLRGLAVPVAQWLRVGEGWAVLGVSIMLILVLAGAIALLAPSVAEQVQLLRVKLPQSARQAADFIGQFPWGQAMIRQMPSADTVMEKIDTGQVLTGVGGVFSSTVGAIGNFFIVILLSIYLAAEPRLYSEGFLRLFPPLSRKRAGEVLETAGETLRWWLIGKIGSMIFIGVLTWVGLSIIGVPLALTLGLLAGLLSFIPNFGPIISAVPALLLAFINSPMTALYVLGLYIGVQVIESNLVTPYIERQTVELPPALTVIFQLALAVTVGGLGLVLATPLLALLVVIVQMVYISDVLGDKTQPEISPAASGPEIQHS